MYFKYNNDIINKLKAKDVKIKDLIEKHGFVQIKVENDLFLAIVDSLLSQQISLKAALTIKERLRTKVAKINALNINNLTVEEINSLGIPKRRAIALKAAASFFIDNPNYQIKIKNLTNSDKIKELTRFSGIGPWTAEMLLIHTFQELDILPTSDLGIKRALMDVYELESITKTDESYFKELFSPYGTVAAFYLWKASEKK